MMTTKFYVPDEKLSEAVVLIILSYFPNNTELRKEFQPQIIARLLKKFYSKKKTTFDKAGKNHLGCGAGKTKIFLGVILYLLVRGDANKILLTAPRLALIKQHIEEFKEMVYFGKLHRTIPDDFSITVYEISSSGQKRDQLKLEDQEIYDQEHEEDSVEIELDDVFDTGVKYIATQNNKNLIKKALTSKEQVIFIGCIPSIKNITVGNKKFLHKIKDQAFDLTIHDEYHNWISQSKSSTNKTCLEILTDLTNLSLYFSATPRYGKQMSSADSLFGEDVSNVPTVKLKEWGYLKKYLKIIFVLPGRVYDIADSERDNLINKGIDPVKWFKECSAIIKCLSYVKEFTDKAPHFLTATCKVAHIKEMIENPKFDFIQKVKDFDCNAIVKCIHAGTRMEDRENFGTELNRASDNQLTLTLQHSILCEGINITNFNSACTFRGMNDIVLNQFLNRITRFHRDYETAYMFYCLEGNETEEYKNHLQKFISKLWNIGLSIEDYEVEVYDLAEKGGDGGKDDDDPISNFINLRMKEIKTILEECLLDQKGFEKEQITEENFIKMQSASLQELCSWALNGME